MKKFFKSLLRIWYPRKARQITNPAFNSDQTEILCTNADEIMSYILDGTPYIPNWRLKDDSQNDK